MRKHCNRFCLCLLIICLLEYVFGSFSELYQMLLDGEIDLLAGLAYTEERKDIVGYPRLPMGSETYNIS